MVFFPLSALVEAVPQYQPFYATTKDEIRHPLFSFEVQDTTYGFYFAHIPWWIEILSLLIVVAVLSMCFGAIVFFTIVRRARTPIAGLLGFGLYIPFWLTIPRILLDHFGVSNLIFRFCLGGITSTLTIFRISEAVFGFSPAYSTSSFLAYSLYFGSPMLLRYDKKTDKLVPATYFRMCGHLIRFASYLLMLGLYQSCFEIFDFFPNFGKADPEKASTWYSIESMYDLHRWKDTLLYGLLFQMYLATFGEGLIFATTVLSGRETEDIMDNPILQSHTPSEFWGRRWNLLVHQCLKNGAYKPVRSMGGPALLAVFSAFLASGLFHESLLSVIFTEFPNTHGTTIAFFMWQAVLVSIDASFGDTALFKSVGRKMPGPLCTLIIIVLGIPLGHWFADSYVRTEFFRQGHIALFSILPTPNTMK